MQLDYKRRIKKPGYTAFPDAVNMICAAVHSADWNANEFKKWLPSQISRSQKSKKTVVKRWVLHKEGHKYKLTSIKLAVPAANMKEFRHYKALHREIEKLLVEKISVGEIQGVISLPYHPHVPLDQKNENILRAQCDVVFCTGYIGLHLPQGLYYGVVSIPTAAVEKIIKRKTVAFSSFSYLKKSPEIVDAHRQMMQLLKDFVVARGKIHVAKVSPLFVVADFTTKEAYASLAKIAVNELLRGRTLAPDTARRVIRATMPKHTWFSSERGGRSNAARRREAEEILKQFWPHIALSNFDDVESEEDKT